MFTKPEGPELNPVQARHLDDALFGSRPFQYFSARIASLLSNAGSPQPGASPLQMQFAQKLGAHEPAEVLSFREEDRVLHVATDSFAVRHHAAEALVRLYHALAVARRAATRPAPGRPSRTGLELRPTSSDRGGPI